MSRFVRSVRWRAVVTCVGIVAAVGATAGGAGRGAVGHAAGSTASAISLGCTGFGCPDNHNQVLL
jgi:hypothetical protein